MGHVEVPGCIDADDEGKRVEVLGQVDFAHCLGGMSGCGEDGGVHAADFGEAGVESERFEVVLGGGGEIPAIEGFDAAERGVGGGQAGIEGEGFRRRLGGALEQVRRGMEVEEGEQAAGVGEAGAGQSESGVPLERLLEADDACHEAVFVDFVAEVEAFEIVAVGGEVALAPVGGAGGVLPGEVQVQAFGDLPGYAGFESRSVAGGHMVTVAPKLPAVGVDEFGGEGEPLSAEGEAAAQNGAGVQFAADGAGIRAFGFVAEGAFARDDAEAGRAGEIIDDAVGDAVAEVLGVGVRAVVGERQDGEDADAGRFRGGLAGGRVVSRCDEAVAAAGQGFNELRVAGGVVEGVAETPDGRIQAVVEVHVAVGPKPGDEFLPAYEFPGRLDEMSEDFEGLAFDSDLASLTAEFEGSKIEFEVGETNAVRRLGLSGHAVFPWRSGTAIWFPL